ncbi:MAG: toll-Interleukin receptor [Actinomycetota bacterium]|nr:toll-Interleukin receptor [Actinomycetota bacterium]
MTYYTERFFLNQVSGITASAAASELRVAAKSAAGDFDVFLSHSVSDQRVILGVRKWLMSKGLSVYVDWIVDRQLDRSHVSPATAAVLRRQMHHSRTLIYATSRAASASRWMPWELGFFDGIKGSQHISILPIDDSTSAGYAGEEYLGLYKRIEQLTRSTGSKAGYAVSPSGTRVESVKSFAHDARRYEDIDAL